MNSRYALFLVSIALTMTACAQRPSLGDRESAWQEADRDGDGHLSRTEYLARRQATFQKMDRTSDGFLAQDDLGRLARRRPETQARLSASLKQADADNDGRVSRAEFDAASHRTFQRWDRDSNGLLSPQEIRSGSQADRD